MNIVINSVLHTGRAAAWRVTANQGVYSIPSRGHSPVTKASWNLRFHVHSRDIVHTYDVGWGDGGTDYLAPRVCGLQVPQSWRHQAQDTHPVFIHSFWVITLPVSFVVLCPCSATAALEDLCSHSPWWFALENPASGTAATKSSVGVLVKEGSPVSGESTVSACALEPRTASLCVAFRVWTHLLGQRPFVVQ